MPEARNLGPLVYKEGLNINEYVSEKVCKVRENFKKNIESISRIENKNFQCICLFSLIDSFAQENANYPTRGDSDAFVSFVIKYQNICEFIEKVEPVTLFYDIEECIGNDMTNQELHEKYPDIFPIEKEIDISKEKLYDETLVENIINTDLADRLLEIAKRERDPKFRDKMAKKHCFAYLLYKMRSKLVHELSSVGMPNKWEEKTDPFYRYMGRIYPRDGDIVSDDVFELVIPVSFIKRLTVNCVNNYLDECITNGRDPFENDKLNRKYKIAWND